MDGTVLVADDDRTIRTVLTQALTRAGCKVRSTGSVNTLWRWVEEGEGDAIVSDVMLPDGNGLELLPSIKRKRPDLPVIVISAQNTVMTAIKASESGAYDYLPKPFDLKELLSKVNKALSQGGPSDLRNTLDVSKGQDLPLIGSAPAMQEVYRLLARVLNTDLSVMISGESGAGKSLLARSLHELGHRNKEDYVVINAPTLTADKIEGILLGGREDQGVDAALQGATIYLDEIAEMTADSQVHLLEMLRSDAVKAKNFRFISSTRRILSDLVNEGSFREDLFYRLNVVPIALPPLRDRLGDIAELTHHFLQQAATTGLPSKTISAKALEHMRSALWTGNVRELENFVNRMVIMAPEDEISGTFVSESLQTMPRMKPENDNLSGEKLSTAVEAHIKRYFDLHGDALPPPGMYNRILREVELPLIALSLAATRGNQIKTAELLGINRNTLRKKISDLDIVVTRSKKMM
ncbi:nitrogen regulation protein NR(I) [Amylibacter ulvae]|uniref:DNA-binding transcriptional regulator NtrC n=1 Tax=Paramylibacter ulvae TaxID=1651968 RepID=A0ABQ3CXX0_9RHOB|nr:sigma 54-interacting transcriptional regulator [Amylibacter ulvae]GHA41445.1 nitrogen regulation protein NR(I) [Amylibacter ulvae]